MSYNINEFWDWFVENQFEYYVIDSIEEGRKEELLNQLMKQLHLYCEGLYFEISSNIYGRQELIVSAGGDQSLFNVVDDLIRSAPQLEKWKFTALKPAVEEGFEIEYEGILISIEDLYFARLKPKEGYSSSKIGIRLYLEKYNNERKNNYQAAAWIIIESILGERSCAEDIDYIDVAGISNPAMIEHNIKKGALFPLSELKKYIDSKKQ